jgi:hypothetical protein
MRRLHFSATESVAVHGSSASAWAFVDRLPQALAEFAFVREVLEGKTPRSYVLVLGPVGYGKVSMTLRMEMAVSRDIGSRIVMQSVPGEGNADATVSVQVVPSPEAGHEHCSLQISLEVSPHKPAAAFWPRELIERASSASLKLAARRMLANMKAAIEADGLAPSLHSRRATA